MNERVIPVKFISYDNSPVLKFIRPVLIGIFIALIAHGAQAQTFPPFQGEPVIDAADIINDAQEVALNQELRKFADDNGGRQIMVATVPSLEGYDVTDYGYRYARFLGAGSKETGDGVVFIIAPNDRQTSIEVGYGLEATLTDTAAKLIIENEVIPSMKEGDYTSGIVNGTKAIMASVTPEAIELAAENARKERIRSAESKKNMAKFLNYFLFFGLFCIIIFIAAFELTKPRRRRLREEKAERLAKEMAEIHEREKLRAAIARRRAIKLAEDRRAAAAHRAAMLAAMSPEQREHFLAMEAAQAAERQQLEEKKREAQRLAEKKRRREAEERRARQRREDSYSSSSYGGSSSSSKKSSSFTPGGGSFGGGGASGSW